MEIVMMTPPPRPLVIKINTDQQAFDEDISVSMDGWCSRDVSEDGKSMVVCFEDESQVEYQFIDPDHLITFIEYMDK